MKRPWVSFIIARVGVQGATGDAIGGESGRRGGVGVEGFTVISLLMWLMALIWSDQPGEDFRMVIGEEWMILQTSRRQWEIRLTPRRVDQYETEDVARN